VLYNFAGGADGASPYGGVIGDGAGNLYGTTHSGGSFKVGVVYELSPSGVEKVLFNFGTAGTNGNGPSDGVVRDSAGNLYGTATLAVFKLTPSGQYTTLALYACQFGGEFWAGVVLDAAGNLYGTTGVPTLEQCDGDTPVPYGAVYKINTFGQLKVLYAFPGESAERGQSPNAGVILDATGRLYGSATNSGAGTVYEIDSAGQTTLYTFPAAPGGTADGGVLYKVSAAGKETALYNFTGGVEPFVARDSAGNFYGAAGNGATGLGEIYKLSAAGEYSVLYGFTGGPDGSSGSGVIVGPGGNLYGVSGGAVVPGLVFKLSPSGQFTVLYAFGTLALCRMTEDTWSGDDIAFLVQVANQIAIAVENSLSYRELAEMKERLATEKLYLEDEIRLDHNNGNMVGQGLAFQSILKSVQIVAPTDSTVLILGETGTGKELVARAVHELSPRRKGSFVKVNCAAIPASLLGE
jgi:uncharacterized repeat protein (TIGR03803 family)